MNVPQRRNDVSGEQAREEDRELLRRYHDAGDMTAREELIERHLPLVRSLARRYAGPATAESSLLAANPELAVARGYSAPAAWNRGASFLAANPELMVARRYGSELEESQVLAEQAGQ